MNHLTSDEMIDAVEGVLDPSRREHLQTCAECAREVAALAAVLKEAQAVAVPEPSPLFWAHFSERVRIAVESEALPRSRWLTWPVLAPIAALAMIVITVMVAVPRNTGAPPPATNPAIAQDVELSDEGWLLVVDLVGELDLETAGAAGVTIAPGTAELAALELNAQEQQELGRLIRAELDRVKS